MADLRQNRKKRVLNFSRPKKKFVQIYKKKYGPNTTFLGLKNEISHVLIAFFITEIKQSQAHYGPEMAKIETKLFPMIKVVYHDIIRNFLA